MKLKDNESLLEDNLNHEPYAEDTTPQDPIQSIVSNFESIRDIEEQIFIHMQQLSEKYPDYEDFKYVYEEKSFGSGARSGWFNLIGIKAVSENIEVTNPISGIVSMPVGAGKTGTTMASLPPTAKTITAPLGVGSKSALAYTSTATWTQQNGNVIKISDMKDGHLINAINMCDKKILSATDTESQHKWAGRKALLIMEKDSRGI